ncbi:MAG: hemerythrin domain-containing protein [Treponemataceae bacterium]
MDMELYITKHRVIQDYLKKITELANSSISRPEAQLISEMINKMTGVLNMHLASEDSYIYPALLKHPDEKVRSITQKYMEEMKGLSVAYSDFYKNYNIPSKILADTEGFRVAFKTVNDALTLRINREESELYTFAN